MRFHRYFPFEIIRVPDELETSDVKKGNRYTCEHIDDCKWESNETIDRLLTIKIGLVFFLLPISWCMFFMSSEVTTFFLFILSLLFLPGLNRMYVEL